MLSPARRSIAVTGVVQGVGFRPFVHSLASRLGLAGFVRNRAGGVIIEVEGAADALDRFVIELRGRPPPLARIEELCCEDKQPRGEAGFRIDASESRPGGTVFISPDVATCPDCLRELDDPGDRRHRYPFLNCTNCGPRLTIVTGAPYDRERTTMAAFAMCARCRREYDDPRDRRFHAQPTCCPRCGPSLRVLDARALPLDAPDPVTYAARALLAGRIGAIKGLGGYHLACDARRETRTPLVMTSGNRSDEPIAHEDRDAFDRLQGIADFFLVHDRPIHTRCDDSVVRLVGGRPLPTRRSRGYAPMPSPLPAPLREPALALGGQLKSVFALGEGRRAFLSHHLGDLDHPAALRAWEQSIARYRELCRIEPRHLVHDLHPDYASTRWAEEQALPRIAVQHHHAHFASCLAENGVNGPAIGVCFDGTGYGLDGTIWGGEFLVGDLGRVERAAHLLAVPMPGGEQAIREPWRMAVSYLRAAGEEVEADGVLLRMLERGVSCPLTSSMGRLFDAAAAISGLRGRVSYEGQRAVELEWLATGADGEPPYPVELDGGIVDTRPLIRALARDAREGLAATRIARRFHSGIVELIARTCVWLRDRGAPDSVALSGGVFMNAILLEEASQRLSALGFRVLRHRLVPPNDGGLALGQLAAACME